MIWYYFYDNILREQVFKLYWKVIPLFFKGKMSKQHDIQA